MSDRKLPKTPCPICGKPAEPDFQPFCSQRCADVDLGRWLNERYVIPGPEGEMEGELPEAEEPRRRH